MWRQFLCQEKATSASLLTAATGSAVAGLVGAAPSLGVTAEAMMVGGVAATGEGAAAAGSPAADMARLGSHAAGNDSDADSLDGNASDCDVDGGIGHDRQ